MANCVWIPTGTHYEATRVSNKSLLLSRRKSPRKAHRKNLLRRKTSEPRITRSGSAATEVLTTNGHQWTLIERLQIRVYLCALVVGNLWLRSTNLKNLRELRRFSLIALRITRIATGIVSTARNLP